MAEYKFRVRVKAHAVVHDVVVIDVPDGVADSLEEARMVAFHSSDLVIDGGITVRWRCAAVYLDTVETEVIEVIP